MNKKIYKECAYFLGIYDPIIQYWYINPHRFLLTKNKKNNMLIGQYISSNTFCSKCDNHSKDIIILKVAHNVSFARIEIDINKNKNINKNGSLNLPHYVKKYYLFNLNAATVKDQMNTYKKKNKQKFDFNRKCYLTLKSKNDINNIYENTFSTTLTFKIFEYEKKMYITLPFFNTTSESIDILN